MNFKNFFKGQIKINKKLSRKDKRNIGMYERISKKYIDRAYCVIFGKDKKNTIGGMFLGSVIFLEKMESMILEKESKGINMSEYKKISKNIRIELNKEFLIRNLKKENSSYEEVLIKKGFLEN